MGARSVFATSWRFSSKDSRRFPGTLPISAVLGLLRQDARESGCTTRSLNLPILGQRESFARQSRLSGKRKRCGRTLRASARPAVRRRKSPRLRVLRYRFGSILSAAPHAEPKTRSEALIYGQAGSVLRAAARPIFHLRREATNSRSDLQTQVAHR